MSNWTKYGKAWAEANREKCREARRRWGGRHPEKVLEKTRAYRKKHPERIRAYSRKWSQKLKRTIIELYGGNCNCCGETELEFLSIDHIKGGGRKELRKLNIRVTSFYRWLRKQPLNRRRYRVLCMNCQCGFKFGRTCPHKLTGLRHENDL